MGLCALVENVEMKNETFRKWFRGIVPIRKSSPPRSVLLNTKLVVHEVNGGGEKWSLIHSN